MSEEYNFDFWKVVKHIPYDENDEYLFETEGEANVFCNFVNKTISEDEEQHFVEGDMFLRPNKKTNWLNIYCRVVLDFEGNTLEKSFSLLDPLGSSREYNKISIEHDYNGSPIAYEYRFLGSKFLFQTMTCDVEFALQEARKKLKERIGDGSYEKEFWDEINKNEYYKNVNWVGLQPEPFIYINEEE